MPARNRCLCQSRTVIGLAGLIIQLKRFGLMIKRFIRGLWSFLISVILWLLSLPARIVRGLWISLFWPIEPQPAPSPSRNVSNLNNLTQPQKPAWNCPNSPTDWDRFLAWSGNKLNRFWRIGKLHARRASRHAKLAFRERTAWTFATVSGSLGILLMIFLQVMYSFQTLKATEHPGMVETQDAFLKTRVDPGFPQARGLEPISTEIAQTDPFAIPENMPPRPMSSPPEPWQDPLGTLPPREPLPIQPAPQREPLRTLPPQEPRQDPLGTLPPREPLPPQPISEPLPRAKAQPFVDPLDMLPPRDAEPQGFPSPLPLSEPAPNDFPPVPSDVPQFDPNKKAIPAPEPLENPFGDPLGNLPPISPRPEVRPQPQEFRPAIDPLPQTQPAPMPKENSFVDPLDNLPPIAPRPEVRPQPQEFRPEFDPLPQTQPVPMPMPKGNSFVDPLDNLPPISPRPEVRPQPQEFRPEFNPLPQTQPVPMPMPKENPFVDPLDNLPPISPRPEVHPQPQEFRPAIDPLPEVRPEPQSRVAPDLDLNLKFLRLPQEDNERFLAESNSAIRRNNLSREVRFDEWDRAMQRKQESPLVPKSYWDQLSHTQRDRLEQELFQSSLQTQEVPGQQTPRGNLQLAIEKILPKRSTAGQPLRYEIVVENRGREMIETVDVDEAVPSTHQLTDVTPAGHFENNLLRWRLREIQPGEKRRLSVEVIPAETGTIETTTSVRPSTTIGSVTQVEHMQAASLKLSVTAPKRVRVGDPCPLVFRITNTGSQDAENVILREQLPNGLSHGNGQDMELKIGRLPAGATREVRLIPIAKHTGEIENVAEVSTGDQVQDSSTTRTQVYNPPLRLRRFGYKTVSVNETVLFTNHVQNLTQFAQRNVSIVEQVPPGFQVVNVEDRGQYDRNAGTITWNLASLPAGETAKLGVRLKAQRMGELQSRVKGETHEGEAVPIRARISSSQHQTQRPTTQTRQPLNFSCASCCDPCCRCSACCCR